MTRLSVWAPDAERVDVLLGADGADRRAMAPVEGDPERPGWWALEAPEAAHGTRYAFSLDGGPARPDPRSRWQPDGPLEPSAVLDPAVLGWTDGAWRGRPWSSAVVYELHIGTFTAEGTFDGAIGRLDHLVDLGVTAVELLPVAEAPGERGWGYDGVDLWAAHHAYGGPEGLARLVDAAHARGLAVILDVVYNHLGPAGNFLGEFGPYFTDRYSTPWGQAINVDGPGSDEVRRFIIDNACAWLADLHLDGLRLDAVHAIIDQSALPILEELAGAVGALAAHLGRPLWLIAESDRNDPRVVQSPEAGGFGLTASWNDDWHHALHSALTGDRSGYYEDYGPLSLVARTFERVFAYGRDWSVHRGRHHGRPAGDLPRSRWLAYLQNHDQVGNRAAGDRMAAMVATGRLMVGAALVCLGPAVPMLWMGEEWAASTPWQYFTDHQDPELGRAVSEGRKREFSYFGWDPDDVPDPQDRATFERSVLRWDELGGAGHAEVLAWHRQLLALRRDWPDLVADRPEDTAATADDRGGWLEVRRGRVRLHVNLGQAERSFDVPGGSALLAASQGGIAVQGAAVVVPPDAVAVTGPAAGPGG